MGDFITQQEFNLWCPDSLAPITHEVAFLKISLDLIEKHYAAWLNYWANDAQDQMHTQFGRKEVTADLAWVDAKREDLPGLLLPQNTITGRHLFCPTDSPWTAVFAPNPLPTFAVVPMMQSLVEYINECEGNARNDTFSYVEILAKPRTYLQSSAGYVADSHLCPHKYFASNGNCRLRILDNTRISLGVDHGRHLEIGHREYARSGSRYNDCMQDGFRFLRSEEYDALGIESEDFISELPESFDDIGEDPILGPEIWNIFGFREMGMICDDFGISPFSEGFYADRGLLATTWFDNEPRFTAVPRVGFDHYQRMIGAGPDVIRSR